MAIEKRKGYRNRYKATRIRHLLDFTFILPQRVSLFPMILAGGGTNVRTTCTDDPQAKGKRNDSDVGRL